MPYQPHLLNVSHPDLVDHDALARRVDQLLGPYHQRYQRLWSYYRNPMLPASASTAVSPSHRPYRQAQEWGLPPRITGALYTHDNVGNPTEHSVRKEVVIENDIAWRVDTIVDFLFGRTIQIESAAADPKRKAMIEELLRCVIHFNGDSGFFQKLALLGSVYGFVDVVAKYEHTSEHNHVVTHSCTNISIDTLRALAKHLRWEIAEPPRAIAFVDEADPQRVVAHAQVWRQRRIEQPRKTNSLPKRSSFFNKLLSTAHQSFHARSEYITVVELLTDTGWHRYEDEVLVASGTNSLGKLPVVHIQNVAIPFEYEGASDVEPLIPIQDELNTRLSDRAFRITMQSSKMYLGKGIANFNESPVSPGRMWSTDNLDASVIEFGGDSNCPSEESHISDLREAMDKLSGVSPIAAGAIKGRIGRLTSAAALRVTFLALLARTTRKHLTYGPAIADLCELTLAWLDHAGLFQTSPQERQVKIIWPSPIPDNDLLRLDEVTPEVSEESP
jgi:Phage portal protein, SPP1 Gp6-like